ncbi:MAG TPA: DUF4411 family protein, partial [Devosia sp.]|nr:DUF4411 family protein [Devosia sp.]
MNRVSVKPEMLHWARERAGVPVDALLRRFPRFQQWETGEVKPTLKQLERFARATYIPVGYLFLDEPPVEEVPLENYYLVAHAQAAGHTVVTDEVPSASVKKIKIPDACIGLGIK